ncbi:MAG TPA: class I SAM-dependent methyltransferase [Nitrospinota bacterium]|nr:class I SAM-dependent methyltransferase [Nitrospinota bacterium]
MSRCKVCGYKTESIISFGKMPIANGFITSVSDEEFTYELKIDICTTCFMVQLGETVRPDMMFNENYHFISSTSIAMEIHFEEIANEIATMISSNESPFVVELGCNDGIMLRHILAKKIRHLGVEPSKNVALLAREKGIEVLEKFFNSDIAREIVKEYGQADVICGSNVMCHIEDINSVFDGINILLKNKGIFFFEDPYLLDVIKKTSFDQIYDEHIYYFFGLSVSELAKRHRMQLVDMVHQDVHGGSMRYYLKKGNQKIVSDRIKEYLSDEKRFKLYEPDGYLNFRDNVNHICKDLKNTLLKLKRAGNRIAGYGATSKSTTLLNYAGIGPDIIDYISDITPTKINKYTPGMHIPVKSHEFFINDNPPYTLLLAWNHEKEILNKEGNYRKREGKFITYFPELSIK